MNEPIILEPGYEVLVTSDSRTDHIWLKVVAGRGCIGVKLSKKDANLIRKALFEAIYPKP